LFPGFCNNPVDLKENFKGLARTLGEHLQQRKELRLDILVSFSFNGRNLEAVVILFTFFIPNFPIQNYVHAHLLIF
jgi:hypothetical protein